MSGKVTIGAMLVVGSIVLAIEGYNRSQPTFEERLLTGAALLVITTEDDPRSAKKGMEEIKAKQFNRGLPFYVIACITGVAGIGLLVDSVKKE